MLNLLDYKFWTNINIVPRWIGPEQKRLKIPGPDPVPGSRPSLDCPVAESQTTMWWSVDSSPPFERPTVIGTSRLKHAMHSKYEVLFWGRVLVHQMLSRVARLAFFRPNFRNLATFQVGWPKKIYMAFFGLITSWLVLKNCLAFLRSQSFLWSEILPLYSISFGNTYAKVLQ